MCEARPGLGGDFGKHLVRLLRSRQQMKNTSFEHHGHQVITDAWQSGDRWSWSYRIDDREPVNLAESGSRSRRQAFHEARHEAIAAITALHAGL